MSEQDRLIESIRAVRDEARKLEIACLQIAEQGTILHAAFDPGLAEQLDQALTHRLRLIQ